MALSAVKVETARISPRTSRAVSSKNSMAQFQAECDYCGKWTHKRNEYRSTNSIGCLISTGSSSSGSTTPVTTIQMTAAAIDNYNYDDHDGDYEGDYYATAQENDDNWVLAVFNEDLPSSPVFQSELHTYHGGACEGRGTHRGFPGAR